MKTLFISPIGAIHNLTPISLGFVEALEDQGLKVGFVKPISRTDNRSANLYTKIYKKTIPDSIDNELINHLITSGEYDQILELVIAKVSEAAQGNDIVVIEGSISDSCNPFGIGLNVDIARTLCSGIVFAGNAGNNTATEIIEHLALYAKLYSEAKTWFAGYVANKIAPGSLSGTHGIEIPRNLDLIAAIEHNPALSTMPETIDYIAKHLDIVPVIEKLNKERERRMPPSAFRFQLMEDARRANKRIVLPEGDEPRTIKAAAICTEKGIARCVLLGHPDQINRIAKENNVQLPEGIEIINPEDIRERYIEAFVALRKHKGATVETARQQLQDNVVVGTMMLAENEVDGLVSGAVHTTADTIRPALQLIGTDADSKIVSSVFFMLMPDQVHVYGDCAVNPNPTPEQLSDIAIQSANSANKFGITPRVAMISYSTGSSGIGIDVEAVTAATKLAQEKRPDLMIDGPLQFDAASVPSVGKQKAPDSQVAGKATVFIFPDLNTGNTTYKAVQRSANVVSIGPMLQGLAKPVNDLSRGALVDDIVYTIAMTAVQAAK